MAIRTGKGHIVMSAFNKRNGQYCSVKQNIFRGEWGSQGFVVNDWGDYDESANGTDEMAARNDWIHAPQASTNAPP